MAARGMGTKYQGSKWIRREKRLAIYLRDGLACVYCGATVEDGAMLTLDHIQPHCTGVDNHETNLVTACRRCNSSRADRPVAEFATAIATYLNHGVKADDIVAHVQETAQRPIDVAAAKDIIARRGSWAMAIQ